METLSPESKKVMSTADVIALAKARAELKEPEAAPEPTQTENTIEDYVDTLEKLKMARRFVAKAYEKYAIFSDPDLDSKASISKEIKAKIHAEKPNWEEHFPKDDSPEEQERWQKFVMSFNDSKVQRTLIILEKASKKHQEVKSDPSLQADIKKYSDEKLDTFRRVAAYRALEREEAAIASQIDSLQSDAEALGESEWPNTDQLQDLTRDLANCQSARNEILATEADKEELERRRVLDAKRQLDSGMLITEQMAEVMRKNKVSLIEGQPLILFGETGGAKTALARYLAACILMYTGKKSSEPELISGFDEINVYQLMGKSELRTDEDRDAAYTEFIDGPITRAMREGRPIILDEVNAMPPGIIKRLNIIMQLRPGDPYKVQENNGEEIIVQPGFCIIATMNEKSHRYKGIDDLSSEYKDRFAFNVARIEYPDQNVLPGGDVVPPDLFKLAMLMCTDKKSGMIKLENMSVKDLLALVRVAHFSQYLYTHSSADANVARYVSAERVSQHSRGETGLSKRVISPRTMLQLIDKVQNGRGSITLQEAITDYLTLDAQTNPEDTSILRKLFEDYGLLPVPESEPAGV